MKIAMHKFRDPRDNFIMTAPNYKIMQQATLPEFLMMMRGYGEYSKGDAVFKMHRGGTCYMRTATDPNSIVGITRVRMITGDEAGLFPLYFHENIQARASFMQCPIMYTTSPYSLNWLYTDYIRPRQKDPNFMLDELELIQATSKDNPYFPEHEYERKKRTMDPKRFNMVYGGEFNRMEGLVYDFDEDLYVVPQQNLPDGTIYIAGVDWGYTNPAVILVFGITPNDGIYLIAEHYKSGLRISELVDIADKYKKRFNIERFYCDPSSPANIMEFNKAKLTAIPAENEIRGGIDAVYEIIANGKLRVFEGRAPNFLDEMASYHYPTEQDIDADTNIKELLPVKQYDHACIEGNQMVMTPTGSREIKLIKKGDYVLTPLGFKKVTEAGKTGEKELMSIEWKNGSILITDDHPVYNPMTKRFDAARYCDNFIVCDMKEKNTILTANIGGVLVRSIKLLSIFTGLYGKIISDLYQKISIYTIKTKTHIITISRISNVSIIKSIYQTTVRGLANLLQNRRMRQQPNGMEVKKAKNFIKNSEKYHTRKEKKSIGFVKIVSAISEVNTNPDIARTIASLSIDVSLKLMRLIEAVNIVGLFSKRINTVNPNIAQVVAAKKITGLKEVYNLEVEGAGCFYVNGVLVSNCDAMRYVLFAIRNTWGKKRMASRGGVTNQDLRMHHTDHLIKQRVHEDYDW